MKLELPEEAIEFGTAAEKAFAGLGGVDVARQAEADPAVRRGLVASTVEGLGVADLDPRADLDTAAAAGELCRAAGRTALPYPIVSVLLTAAGFRLPLALVPDPARARVDHGDLFGQWRVATTGGWSATASPDSAPLASKLGPFVCDLAVTATPAEIDALDIDLHLTLTAWRVLGTAERAVELAVEHVRDRHQFGQALAGFQAVQFQLADAAVAVDGLRELCRFTLWRLWTETARPDALALRLYALDTARAVLRTCQQLHGAAGVCDEYDISILARHVQPDLRLPSGAERTAAELVGAVEAHGFESLFPHGGAA